MYPSNPNGAALAAAPATQGHRHAVQFYEDDGFLCDTLASFVSEGLAAGRPALVIATEAHRDGLADRLTARGVEVARARVSGQLTLLDARELLSQIMDGALPDAVRFRAVVGDALTLAARGRDDPRVYVFGELVDLLWKDGNPESALRLEVLWNELARTHDFALLCGYGIGNFHRVEDADAFLEICGHHDHVAPTEQFASLSEDERLRRLVDLEQRARALQTEVEYRRHLEKRLHALAAEADAANRAKSDFLSAMSHELRTPLNVIGGYADLVDDGIYGPVTGEQRQAMARLKQSQQHLLRLVDDLLQFARIEQGQIDVELGEVCLAELLGEMGEMLDPQLRAAGLSFACEMGPAPLMARGDRGRVRQILLNLVGNAIKFTPAGGRIQVSCDGGDGSVDIRVHDSGPGIPEEMVGRIFDPFVQVRDPLTRDPSRLGVGLGLAISRDLAHAMGGELTVRSTLGMGSTFALSLPRVEGTPTA
jgi:signal transduction histidine kinase